MCSSEIRIKTSKIFTIIFRGRRFIFLVEPGEGCFCIFMFGWSVFSSKLAKRGSVNSVSMRFSITIVPGRVSDLRLKGD